MTPCLTCGRKFWDSEQKRVFYTDEGAEVIIEKDIRHCVTCQGIARENNYRMAPAREIERLAFIPAQDRDNHFADDFFAAKNVRLNKPDSIPLAHEPAYTDRLLDSWRLGVRQQRFTLTI